MFTLVFFIFLKSRWFFLNCCSLNYSLTKLQNYSLSESLIRSFEAPKSGKTTTTKQISKSLKKHHKYIYWVYQDSRPQAPSAPKGNIKFDILLVKVFRLKQKTKLNISSYYRKIKFLLFKKNVWGSFRWQTTMSKCKTKAIRTDLGTFRHNQAYPGIF